jgi:hypothetical protein
MAWEEHNHWFQRRCTDYQFCTGPASIPMVGWGPLTAMRVVATGLMEHLGADPEKHSAALHELEQEVGEALLELGEQFLAEHNIPRDVPV